MELCLRLQSKQNLMQSMSLVARLYRKHNLLMICHSDQCFSTSGRQNFDGAVLRAHQDEMHLFSSYQEGAYLRGGQYRRKINWKMSPIKYTEKKGRKSQHSVLWSLEQSQNKISNVFP